MQPYLDFLRHIQQHGKMKPDRTGTGIISVFGHQMRFNFDHGFPIVTTKRVHLKSVIHELLWFLKGDTNIGYLKQNGVSIWDEWANEEGQLGPVYGKQWRSWQGHDGKTIDQINNVIKSIKTDPYSRRHVVSAWNVTDLPQMALPPCHLLFQLYVANDKLSCQLYQRSADAFLGVPFNITSYALLTALIAHQCDLGLGEFIWTGGDCHLYQNHVEQANLQLTRTPYALPNLIIKRRPKCIEDYCFEDIEIVNYEHHPHIAAQVAV